jgi:hypothetical protein
MRGANPGQEQLNLSQQENGLAGADLPAVATNFAQVQVASQATVNATARVLSLPTLLDYLKWFAADCRSEISRQAIAKVSASDERAARCLEAQGSLNQTPRISFSSEGELISAGALGMGNTRFRVRGTKEVGFPEGERSSGNPD